MKDTPLSSTVPFSCNLCEALCGMLLTLEDQRVTAIRPNREDIFSRGHICPKGPALRELYDDPDRLRTPVLRTQNGWQPIGWEEALHETAERLRNIQKEHGQNAVALYLGNPTVHGHRAALGAQSLALALRTQNRFDANSQDSNPRLFACMQMYGDPLAMTVPDVDRVDYLLLIGANPAASMGSQMSLGDVRGRLHSIRQRGGRIVVIDPRRSETAAWCDAHHFIRPGGDAALALAILHVLFAENRIDGAAVERVAVGLPAVRDAAAHFSPERVAPAIGMDAATIRALANDLSTSPRACVYGRVGTCQNEFGPLAIWLIEVLNIVTGNFDREGGTLFPTPAVDLGKLARWLIGNHYGRWRSRVRGLPEFLEALPSAVMSEEMETPGPGQIRAFACFAGNPVLSTPNGERLGRALTKLDFMVAIDFFINETSRHAHIILPPTHVFEVGNYDVVLLSLAVRNIAKYSPPALPRTPGTRDDWAIMSELALRIALPQPKRLRQAILRRIGNLPEQVVNLLMRAGPYGDRFLPWRRGLTLDALRRTPQGIDLGPLRPSRRERVRTNDGLVRLAPQPLLVDLPRLDKWIDAHSQIQMSTTSPRPLVLIGRRHLRSNNSWMHNAPSLVKGPDRTQLLMNPSDAAERGLQEGALVCIQSRVGKVSCRLALADDLMPGVVSLPHGFGHGVVKDTLRVAGAIGGPNINALTDELLIEPVIGTSILNGVPVEVTLAP